MRSEIEQHIIHEWTRQIANAIIYFNAELLSGLIDDNSANSTIAVEHIKKISPVAWQYINLYGRFEFNDLGTPFNVEEFMRKFDMTKLINLESVG